MNFSTGNKTPIPHDLEVELSLINSIITKNDLFFQIYDKISENDFLNKELSKAFRIIKELILENKPVNKTIVKAKLGEDSLIQDKIVDEFKTAKEIKEYAKILVDKRLKRELIIMGGELMEEGMNQEEQGTAILDKFKIKLSNINTYNDKFVCESITTVSQQHENLIKDRKKRSAGILTGIPKLDEYLIGGFKKGDFIVVGARPSMGKTCLVTQFALTAAANKHKTVFITAEMSKEEIMDRIVTTIGGFNPYDVVTGSIDSKRLSLVYKKLSTYNLKIMELVNGTSQNIISAITKENLLNGVDIIFIDYLSYLRDNEGKLNESVRIGRITKNLKGLARELKIPVVLVSQLNRNSEYRRDKKPDLSDLRESGDIEQDADVVLLIYRKKREDETLEQLTKLYIAKNRKGPVGEINLIFNYKSLMFEPYETRQEEDSVYEE